MRTDMPSFRAALMVLLSLAVLAACGKTDWDRELDTALQDHSGSTEEYLQGLEAFLKKGPPLEHASEARFTLGWVYAETLHQYAEARRWFEELLQNDPNGKFSEDARWMIDNMEKNDDELLEEIRRRAEELEGTGGATGGTPPPPPPS